MASPSIASATKPRFGLLGIARVALMAAGLLFLIVPHLAYRACRQPSPIPMAFLNMVGWLAGLRVRTTGQRLKRDVLFVANHVSWMDILALGGAARSAFVSKSEVGAWPLVGWLADQNHTVYVERDSRAQVHQQAHSLRGELSCGHPVTLFPEGTTGDGISLLPFRASLFQAVAPPPGNLRIQPVLLDYGLNAPDIAWTGDEPTLDNFRRIVGRRQTVPLTIHYLEPLPADVLGDRKAIAEACRSAIAARMDAAHRAV